MDNFRTPYFSKSISEFWKRWHISLSSWFKDYLYISLGGNRVSIPRWYFNLFIVFVISGFWHGANYTFLIWGALHGFYLIFAIEKDKYFKKIQFKSTFLHNVNIFFKIITTFALVTFAWIFFRATNLLDARKIISKIFSISIHDNLLSPLNKTEMFFSITLIIFLLLKEKFIFEINTKNTYKFSFVILMIIFTTYLFGVFNQNQFIYFQF
jgi:D-alanyl-lipoteichoic acid acyltransferase DltB (MBOAT superfamily)